MNYDDAEIRAWVAGVLAGVYAPEPSEEIYEWAERTMKIPPQENSELAGTLWTSARSPYVRELMKWVKQPGKGEFWIRKSSQTGFTMAVLIIICWCIVHRPMPMAYAINSIEEARKISKVRLQNWIKYNALLEEMGEEEDSLNNLTFFLKSSTFYMLSASTVGDWQNKSIELFVLDELDLHPYHKGQGTTVEMARERCKRPKNAKIIGFSTPGETDQITTEFKAGTMEEIRFPFPCCGHPQALKKENLVWSSKEFRDLAGGLDLAKVETEAYFRCELCQGKLFDHQKMAAMQAYESVPTNRKGNPRVRSMHVWDAYSSFVTFGQIALKWHAAEGDPTRMERLYRGTFGEQFDREGRSVRMVDVLECRSTYERGTIPFKPVLFTVAIDLQKDVQKACKVAVDAQGNFAVIDWVTTLALEHAIEWSREPCQGPDGEMFYCTHGWIDEGHRHDVVRRACLANLDLFWPVKGRPGVQMKDTITTSESTVDGEPILTYHIAEDLFKWQLLNMITERKKRLRRGGGAVIHFPINADDDEDFLAEFCNETPIQKTNSLGKKRWEWKVTGPNDFWDTVKYCLGIYTLMRPSIVREGMTAA